MKLYLIAGLFISVSALAETFTIDDVRNIEKYIDSCTTPDEKKKAEGLESLKNILNSTTAKVNKSIKSIECDENSSVLGSPLLIMIQEPKDGSTTKYKVSFRKNAIKNSKTPEVVDRIFEIKYTKMSNEDFEKNRSCENKIERLCNSKNKEKFKECVFGDKDHASFQSCTDKSLKALNECKADLVAKNCPNLKKSMTDEIVWPLPSNSKSGESKPSNKAPTVQ